MPTRKVTVTTSAKRLCVKNKHRKGLLIQNQDASTSLYLGGATVATSGDELGIELEPKQSLSWNREDEDKKYAWYGIVSSGSITVVVNEVY